jgi:hypothetical protein
MSRRPPREEQQFGSDSFLDVVANVVGILIILMVLAGVRAGRAPIVLDAAPAPIAQAETPTDSPRMTSSVTATDNHNTTPRELDPELQSQADALRSETQQLLDTTSQMEVELSEWESRAAVQRNRAGTLDSELRSEMEALQAEQERTNALVTAMNELRVRLQETESAADKAAKQRNVQQLQHRITPISRVITENEVELHFRCLGNAVSVIPLDGLIERMKAQLERQREIILRTRRFSGTVGPARGWNLRYNVETQQHLGMVRASVSQFELVPEPDLEAEPAAVALRPDSLFRNELRKAEPGSTITFWVYPDSFELFRKLQAIVHREGFSVAARPLPAGTPIMGSPHGSRSAAQ